MTGGTLGAHCYSHVAEATDIGKSLIGKRADVLRMYDIESGRATADDTGISVGYVSKDSYGIAVYYEQSNGSWEGVWSYGGSKGVTNETWLPE